MNTKELLHKYHDIIAEEVNVKQVTPAGDDLTVTKRYIPRWDRLWPKFGKDTGSIIWAAKSGNITETTTGVSVHSGDQTWELLPEDYEIRYEWLDESKYTVEWGVIVWLDTNITPELQREWVAREISRFLNQMRKEADYQVSDRVACSYETEQKELTSVISEFSEFLQQEALLSNISTGNQNWDITAELDTDLWTISFTLIR